MQQNMFSFEMNLVPTLAMPIVISRVSPVMKFLIQMGKLYRVPYYIKMCIILRLLFGSCHAFLHK